DPAVGGSDHHAVAPLDRLLRFQLLCAEHAVSLYRPAQAHAYGPFRLQQVASAELADIALTQDKVLRAQNGMARERSGNHHHRLEQVHLCRHKQAPLHLAAVAADPHRYPADWNLRTLKLGADGVRRAQRQTQPGVQAVDADLMPGRLAAGGQMKGNLILKICSGGADKLVDKRIGVQAATAREGNGYNQPEERCLKLHIIQNLDRATYVKSPASQS